jgi:hypothetical protein
MDTEKWFYVLNKPTSFGSFYHDLDMKKLEEFKD